MKGCSTELAALLRQVRKDAGYTQAQIAEKLGMTRSAYTYYETGRVAPSLSTIRALADIYQVSANIFIYPEKFLQNSE